MNRRLAVKREVPLRADVSSSTEQTPVDFRRRAGAWYSRGMSDTRTAKTSPEAARRRCQSCSGSGEIGTESGLLDCPDCGGTGDLPHPSVLVEWRVRDIERARAAGSHEAANDIRWLIAELRRARAALTEIASLAEEAGDSETARRLRLTAGRALDLFERVPRDDDQQS